jgi:hypothetical protein
MDNFRTLRDRNSVPTFDKVQCEVLFEVSQKKPEETPVVLPLKK